MKKKIFFMVSVLSIAMFSSSIIGVVATKKTTTTYILAATFDNVAGPDRYWGKTIPGGQDEVAKWFNKQFETVTLVTLNIGGTWQESAIPGLYEMVGGTSYVCDPSDLANSDFTYEALQFMKGDNVDPEAEPGEFVFSWIHPTVWTTITFLPQSGIEGTIQYKLQLEYLFDPPGTFAGFNLKLQGHGTGDLKGAIFQAIGGPPTLHGGTVTAATHDGTVRGWPL